MGTDASDEERRKRWRNRLQVARRWIWRIFDILFPGIAFWMSQYFVSTLSLPVAPIPVRLYLIFGAAGIALTLYELRSRRRILYGAIEIALGLGIAWQASARLGGERGGLAEYLAFVGAIYVMVRGIDNVSQGKEASRAREGRALVSQPVAEAAPAEIQNGKRP